MATYRDTAQMFAQVDVIERLLEIRAELGFAPAIFLFAASDMAVYMDAYGFDVYTIAEFLPKWGCSFRAPLAPCGDHAHLSERSH